MKPRNNYQKGASYSWSTLKRMFKDNELSKFLISFLIYEDGVMTVIVFSSIFASSTLGFTPMELVVLFIVA